MDSNELAVGRPDIHEWAEMPEDESVIFGDHCRVYAFATICDGARFGVRCVVGSCVFIGRHVVCGDDVRIQHGAFLPSRTRIGHRVFIGPNVTMTDDKHPKVNNPLYRAEPPILEDDVNLGAGVIVLPGVRIGQGSTIAAGAVVVDDVPPGSLVMGIPGRVVRERDRAE